MIYFRILDTSIKIYFTVYFYFFIQLNHLKLLLVSDEFNYDNR